jgi:hypothetical protein
MLIGWIAAPLHLVGLLGAQGLSGLSLTALEGATDARVARDASSAGDVTTSLAWSAATRAMGSSIAVKLLPLVIAAPAIGLLSALDRPLAHRCRPCPSSGQSPSTRPGRQPRLGGSH